MKRSMFNYALTIVMAVGFAVSCGKDGGSGGGSNLNGLQLPSGLPASSANAAANFNNWYSSTTESSNISSGTYKVYRATYNGGTSNGSSCPNGKEIKIFGMEVGCYSFSSSGSNQGQVDSGTNVSVVAGQAKSANGTLAGIVNNSANIVDVVQQSNIFMIVVRNSANTNQFTVYTIDTAYHSAFQPMQTQDTGTGVINYVKTISYYSL